VIHKLITAMVLCAVAALPAQAATKLNFMYTAVGSFVGLYVAKDQGILAKHGLDIDMTLTTNGSLISAALVSGSAQIGGPTPTILLQANEEGLDLVVVAGTNVYPLSFPSGVLAAADSNLHGPKDLQGKRVGVPGLGGIIDVLTRKWVQSNGVDYHKVNWVEIGFPQMADALKSHLVDAVAAVDPFYTRVVSGKTGYDIGVYASTRCGWRSTRQRSTSKTRRTISLCAQALRPIPSCRRRSRRSSMCRRISSCTSRRMRWPSGSRSRASRA
jgi:NitT/TauT family transport system substrate-binding protein